MGFDCTLHAVDEAAFPRFVRRFLHGEPAAAFDAAFPDADAMVAEVKARLADAPATGARLLGQCALLFCSSETPHVTSRGFAISLWDRAALGIAMPTALMRPVEAHLAEILAAYPDAQGEVPTGFAGNYSVGAFVPAAQVGELLAVVESALAAIVPGDRKRYRPLVRILRVAAARGLAYWEGTDLGVAQAHAGWLVEPPPAHLTTAPCTLDAGYLPLVGVRGSERLFATSGLATVDLATWPPALREREDVLHGVLTPWHTTLVQADARLVDEPRGDVLDVPIEPGAMFATRDAVLVFPQAHGAAVPHVVRPGRPCVPLALPPRPRRDFVRAYAGSFGDGSTLLIWDARPYRWDGGEDGACVALGDAPLGCPDGLASVVELPDGALAGGFGRRLLRIDRDGHQTTLAPLDNVMTVSRGPDDTLVVGEGDNPEGDVMKVVWLGSRELTPLDASILGVERGPVFHYHDEARARFVLVARRAWHALDWRVIAALPRLSFAAFADQRAALLARKQAR